MGINGREHDWLCAIGPVLWPTVGNRRHVFYLPRVPVKSGDLFSAGSINDFGIERVGCDVSVFNGAHGMPIPKIDFTIVSAAGDAHRSAFLLPGANAVRKLIADSDVVELCGRLVEPGTPRLSAIDCYQRALIANEQNNFRVGGINPDVLIIVASGCSAKTHPGFPAVRRAHRYDAGAVHHVRVLRIHPRHGQIAAANSVSRPRIGCRLLPVFTPVIGTVNAQANA